VIDEAVDRNSRSELAALRQNIELATAAAKTTFSFTDTVLVDGVAGDVYDFINDAHRWEERLPHVVTARLDEDTPGLQTLEMDTRAKDGSVHTTKSYRVCFPHRKIAYKQITLPALMTLHTVTGRSRRPRTASRRLRSTRRPQHRQHHEGPRPGRGRRAGGGVRPVALSTNSLATLGHAKAHAKPSADLMSTVYKAPQCP